MMAEGRDVEQSWWCVNFLVRRRWMVKASLAHLTLFCFQILGS
jgi:hypothetical protein